VPRLRIGIAGAGSIGCYVGGALIAADAADVVMVGRPRVRDEIAAHGLTVESLGRAPVAVRPDRIRFSTELDALAPCEVILVCVKSAHTADVARRLADVVADDAIVVSLQNGVRNADVLRGALPGRIVVPAVVSFNVVSRDGGVFRRATSGPLILGRVAGDRAAALLRAFDVAGLDVEVRDDLAPDQWTKLLVNLNNAVSALSGAPTARLITSPGFRRIIAAIVDEALTILRAARIHPARLRGVPIRWMPHVMRLPTPLVRLVLRAQVRVDPEARSSMWEDLTRGRPTEVDFLNGEIVRLAERIGADAPLNRRIVELVHAAEAAGPGSPGLDAASLWTRLSERHGR
jgi:2-dehydropantoate 2-reductase